MVILIIGIILYAIIAFGTICIMIGENFNKLEYEKQMEDDEKIKYLREYQKGGVPNGRKVIKNN